MSINLLVNHNFTKSVRIIQKRSFFRKNKNFYLAQSPEGQKLAKFCFKNTGEVSDLKLVKQIRRKKEGICTLFAIKKFIQKKAKKENFDYVTFYAEEKNPNNVVRLYEKFATQLDDILPLFLLPVTKKGKRLIHNITEISSCCNNFEYIVRA